MHLYDILQKTELQCQKVQQWVPETVRAQSTRNKKYLGFLVELFCIRKWQWLCDYIKLPKFIKLYIKWMDCILSKLNSSKPGKIKALTITEYFKFCFILPKLRIFKNLSSNLPLLDCYQSKDMSRTKSAQRPAGHAAHSFPNRTCFSLHALGHKLWRPVASSRFYLSDSP